MALVMAVLAISVQVVGAADSQSWYFTNTDASAPVYSGADYNKIMTKGVEGDDVTITLVPEERVWFYADEVAQCDVTFPAGSWSVAYWINVTNSTDSDKTITTRLHGINSTGFRLSGSTGYKTGTYKTQTSGSLEEVVELLNPDEGFIIPEGGRFAIEVLWASNAAGNLEIHCNPTDKHASNVTSPSSDPGYPVPELSTLVLLSVGLLTLAGYVTYDSSRGKKNSQGGTFIRHT